MRRVVITGAGIASCIGSTLDTVAEALWAGRSGPYQVTRTMGSTVSACATSAHCIIVAAQQIAWGVQDVVFAGGGEELGWGMASLFDGMGALSSARNDSPATASRALGRRRGGLHAHGHRRPR